MTIPYITFRETESGDKKYYILQKAFPHYLGIVTIVPMEGKLIQSVPISDYNLWISFVGTLRGINVIPSYKDVQAEAHSVFTNMALWFKVNRIDSEPKKYKKWKVM